MINLFINERRSGDVTILDLKGRLRVGGNTMALHKTIRCLLLEKKTLIILQLQGVTHVDSCGLGEMVASQISARNKGGEIKLLGLSETLHELLRVNGLMGVFHAFEAEDEAVDSFAEQRVNEAPRLQRGLA